MIVSARLCDQNGKTCNEKNRITDRHIKRHDSTEKLKSRTNHSQVPLTINKELSTPKKKLCLSILWKLKECLVVKTKKKEKLPVLST